MNSRDSIVEKNSILLIEGISKNPRYGYSPDEPIKLGVKSHYRSLTYPDKYFNSITGPHGEVLAFERIKSCCPFKTVNSNKEEFQNVAVLEIYEISYKGLSSPVYLYVNFFDEGPVMAPKGFLPKTTSSILLQE